MRSYLLILALMLAAPIAHAQYVGGDTTTTQTPAPQPPARPAQQSMAEKPPFWDRVSLGGNFGANFGAVTYVDLSPVAMYNVSDRFQIGPGLTYRYFKYSGGNGYSSYSTSQYGGRIFSRYVVYENVFLQGELEAINFEVPISLTSDRTYRTTIINPFVGGGYRFPLGTNGGVYLTALYNLNYRADLTGWIYPSPLVIRVGFTL